MVAPCILDQRKQAASHAERSIEIATLCTQDTSIQHLHDETLILPIHEHMQLHASQFKQKAQPPSHPTQTHNIVHHSKSLKGILNNASYTTNTPTDPQTTVIKANMHRIHKCFVSMHLATRGNNKILRTPPIIAPLPNK